MWQRATRQRQLFDDIVAFHPPQLQEDVQREVTRLLMQWMQALAQAIGEQASDEQDQR
jgi:hypothetical protein